MAVGTGHYVQRGAGGGHFHVLPPREFAPCVTTYDLIRVPLAQEDGPDG